MDTPLRLPSLVCAICVAVMLGAQASGSAQPSPPPAQTLPSTIPIFPLPDVMLFPSMARPLHIFEPRYRALVADALNGDRLIGMVMLLPGYEQDYEGRPPIYAIGCAGRIANVEALPDGSYNILLHGLVKFRVTSEDHSRPYRLAHVEALHESTADADRAALAEQRAELTTLLMAIVPSSNRPPQALPDENLVNGIAQYADIDPLDRQDLLELDGPLARAQLLIDLLDTQVSSPR